MLERWQEQISVGYDRVMSTELSAKYYGESDFFNMGYWTPGVATQREACENLLEKLLSFFPEKHGRILDAACGMGASTRHLLKYFQPENIVGINISEAQLARARQNAPGCTFIYMDASKLEFPDASFDNVISVEAAFHFNTRDKFYGEAWRVLKPGGRLVTSDVLCRRSSKPAENFIENPDGVAEHLTQAGFDDIQVVDVREQVWSGFCASLKRWPAEARRNGQLTTKQYLIGSMIGMLWPMVGGFPQRHFVITSARKPTGH